MAMRGLLILLCLLPQLGLAGNKGSGPPKVSIIIDDIGDRPLLGRRAIDLPGPVAFAILPHAPHSASLAKLAHGRGREVLLHLPMQAVEDGPLGPGAVTMDMDKPEFLRVVRENLLAIPYVTGVNNHMGSLLTRHPGHMTWLMQELRARGDLFFVDSRTTAQTVAEQMAIEQGVPVLRRHVFLDHDASPTAIESEFDRLLALSRRQGYAIAIGHPYPSTLAVLERRLPLLKSQGIELIPLRSMFVRQQEDRTWQASLSR